MAMSVEAVDQHQIDPGEATNQVFQRRLAFVDFTRRSRARSVAERVFAGMIEIEAAMRMPDGRDGETAIRLAKLARELSRRQPPKPDRA